MMNKGGNHCSRASSPVLLIGFLLFASLLAGCRGEKVLSDATAGARQKVYQGMDMFMKGDYSGAEVSYRAAIKLDPNEVEAHVGLGASLASLGQDDGAEAAFREALKRDPKHARAWNGLGVALSGTGNEVGALDAFQHAVTFDPDNAEARFGLGMALVAKGDRAGALDQARALQTLNPKLAAQLRAILSPF